MGTKAELKLLSCQRAEQMWESITGDELIPVSPDQVSNHNSGSLVLIELNTNRQLTRFLETGRQLSSVLQGLSRAQLKFKTQAEEIEQWKESLMYQGQELNRREQELEARQEALQNLERELERLEREKQENARLSAQLASSQADLEAAWAALRQEQQQHQGSRPLDPEKLQHFRVLVRQLSESVASPEAAAHLTGLVDGQQELLDHYWQCLDQERALAYQVQAQLEQQQGELEQRLSAYYETLTAWTADTNQLAQQQQILGHHQGQVNLWQEQLQLQQELYQGLYALLGQGETLDPSVDVSALENMSLEELKNLTEQLAKELENVSQFVVDQEEELTLQQQAIQELQVRMEQASEFEQIQLDAELSGEQENYELLNEALIGQRQRLQERAQIFQTHQAIYNRRANPTPHTASALESELRPFLDRVAARQTQGRESLEQLHHQIRQLQTEISQSQTRLSQYSPLDQAQELANLRHQELEKQREAAEHWGRVNLWQETLQSWQEALNRLRPCLTESWHQGQVEAWWGILNQIHEAINALDAGN